MKFKLADWLLLLAIVLNVASLAVGNRVWQSWVATGLLLATLVLRILNKRREAA